MAALPFRDYPHTDQQRQVPFAQYLSLGARCLGAVVRVLLAVFDADALIDPVAVRDADTDEDAETEALVVADAVGASSCYVVVDDTAGHFALVAYCLVYCLDYSCILD